MLEVKDKGELLKNLRGIRLGDNKLWFNIARFVLEDGEINTGISKQKPIKIPDPKGNVGEGSTSNGGHNVTGEWSFKDMLVGKAINVDDKINAFSSLHGVAVVTRMADVTSLKNIFVRLKRFASLRKQ
ncbi:hypothetical protein Hanom_Chr14g01326741 [Helianthus anomalus]